MSQPSQLSAEELAPRLANFLARSFKESPTPEIRDVEQVQVQELRLLTGGASRQTWSFDTVLEQTDGHTHTLPLILRNDPPGGPQAVMERDLEFRIIVAAYAEDVLVPRPYFLGDDSLGVPFFLMERIDGETIPTRLFRNEHYASARTVMPEQLGRILAKIHQVPVDHHPLDDLPIPEDGRSAAEEEIVRYEDMYATMAREPHPTFELAFRWLRQHMPEDTDRVLVHGDYRMGNIMFGPDGVRSVLDWELAHVGDPMEDLGWMCVRSWRFGSDSLPVGGVGTREAFQCAYEQAGGYPVDPERVRFWEIFGNLRWGVICLNMTQPFLDGQTSSVELASIGRRTAETEWELLHLMEA